MVQMLGILCKALEQANIEPEFSLWVYGLTGSLKTTLTTHFTNLFERDTDNVIHTTFIDTRAALEKRFHEFRHCPVILDDFKPQQSKKGMLDMVEKASFSVRLFGDRVGRRKLNMNHELENAPVPHSMLVITGEDTIHGEHSTLARCLTVPVERKDIDLNLLSELQDHPLDISTFAAHFIQWLCPKMDSISDTLKKLFIRYRSEALGKYSHNRLNEIYAWLMVASRCFLKYGTDIGVIVREQDLDEDSTIFNYDDILNDFSKAFEYLLNQHDNLMKGDIPVTMYLQALEQLIVSNQAQIHKVGEDKYSSNKIGWYDKEMYYLIPDVAYSQILAFWNKAGKVFPLTMRQIHKHLEREQIIVVEYERENDRIQRLVKKTIMPDFRLRVLQIKKDAMDSYLEKTM